MQKAKHKYSRKRTNWRNYTSKYLQLLKTYSNQYSEVLVQGQTQRPMGQTREPRDRHKHIQSVDL